MAKAKTAAKGPRQRHQASKVGDEPVRFRTFEAMRAIDEEAQQREAAIAAGVAAGIAKLIAERAAEEQRAQLLLFSQAIDTQRALIAGMMQFCEALPTKLALFPEADHERATILGSLGQVDGVLAQSAQRLKDRANG